MGPFSEFLPRESFERDCRVQIELKGTVPVRLLFDRSISVTDLFELQVIPVKLQGEFDETQLEKRL